LGGGKKNRPNLGGGGKKVASLRHEREKKIPPFPLLAGKGNFSNAMRSTREVGGKKEDWLAPRMRQERGKSPAKREKQNGRRQEAQIIFFTCLTAGGKKKACFCANCLCERDKYPLLGEEKKKRGGKSLVL